MGQLGRQHPLTSMAVDALAGLFLATGRPLGILVNSAGIMAAPLAQDCRAVDPKGAEQLWTLSERLLDLTFL